MTIIRILKGDFGDIFVKSTLFTTLLYCWCPYDTGDAKIEARTVASLALAIKLSNHSARSHPDSARSHPHSATSHPHSDRSHPHSDRYHPLSARSHPHSARSHPHSAWSYQHSARSHPHSARSHPHSAKSHPRSARYPDIPGLDWERGAGRGSNQPGPSRYLFPGYCHLPAFINVFFSSSPSSGPCSNQCPGLRPPACYIIPGYVQQCALPAYNHHLVQQKVSLVMDTCLLSCPGLRPPACWYECIALS